MKTAHDLVSLAAQRTPQRLALVDDRSERRATYAGLMAAVERLAAGLAAQGIGAGSRFATVLPNVWEHCLLLLALQRLQAVPALINWRLKPAEVAELARAGRLVGASAGTDPALIAALRSVLPERSPIVTVGGSVAGGVAFEDCAGDPTRLPTLPPPHPEDPSFFFYTSGTTGLPKAVVLPHRVNEPRVTWLSTALGLLPGEHLRALGVSPLAHAIGFHGVFLATLAYNGTFYVQSSFDPERALDAIERHRITYLFSLPTIFDALVRAPGYRPERVRSLTHAYWGGATIEPELLERLAREWPARFGHVYGTTETMCSLVNPQPVSQRGVEHDVLYQHYGSCAIVVRPDEPEREAAPGEEGELLVDAAADAVFSGYLDRPEATAEKLWRGWYRTGDAAVRDQGGAIRVLGRIDDMIRCGGEYIQPDEVERALRSHPQVDHCAVIGVPDGRWGQLPVAAVVARGERPDPRALDGHCRASTLANFKRPYAFFFLDQLPATAGGKLMRRELRGIAEAARRGEGPALLIVRDA